MLKRTAVHDMHRAQGAKLIEFAGWEMPLHYGSQLEEHHCVRKDAGVFDVSHMGIIDVLGKDASNFMRYILANNIDKLKTPGKALYTCLLNHEGGIIDDLIVYYINNERFRLVVNAFTTEKDLQWLQIHAKSSIRPYSIEFIHQQSLSLFAIQGPNARVKAGMAMPEHNTKIQELKPFHFFIEKDHSKEEWLFASTGYTGEDGIEILFPIQEAENLWKTLLKAGIAPIGLGARDTLRLEAGFNLYGQDMDETVSPLESNLAWTVAMDPPDRKFIGRQALEKQITHGATQKLTGLILIDKGVLRHDQIVIADDSKVGKVTSGSFSPTLGRAIALARIPSTLMDECSVEVREKQLKAQIVQPPFLRRSQDGKISQRTTIHTDS